MCVYVESDGDVVRQFETTSVMWTVPFSFVVLPCCYMEEQGTLAEKVHVVSPFCVIRMLYPDICGYDTSQNLMDSEALAASIVAQGEKVRALKAQKASKEEVNPCIVNSWTSRVGRGSRQRVVGLETAI